jgi:RimJ/RimL family protein N-acetyltransferase
VSFPIVTDRLELRPFTAADLEAAHAVYADAGFNRFSTSGPARTIADSRARVERHIAHQAANGFSMWPVFHREDATMIGICGLMLVEFTGPELEVGWRLVESRWGLGYATEAGRACLEFGFRDLGLERIIAICDRENIASRRVMEKIGMTPDGSGMYYGLRLVRFAARGSSWHADPAVGFTS